MHSTAGPAISKVETDFVVSLVSRNVDGTTSLRQEQLLRILHLASRRTGNDHPDEVDRTVRDALSETGDASSVLHGADEQAVRAIATEAVAYANARGLDRERFDRERLRAAQAREESSGLLDRLRNRFR